MTIPGEIGELLKRAENLEARATSSDYALYQAAAEEYEKATELSEGYYGNLREETLNIRERWAVSLRNAGDLRKAIVCDLRNVEWSLENVNRCQSRQGNNETVVLHAKQRHLNAQRRLGESYLENKQYTEAIRMFEAIVDSGIQRSAEQICEARVDLAAALFESGTDRNIMDAVNLNIVTLRRAETDLGRDHIETIKIRYNLGAELYTLEKYDDALKNFGEVLEILQLEYCRARSAPDYEEYIGDAEAYLLNCSAKIARRDEKIRLRTILEAQERARNAELESQLAEQQIVEQQVREAMAREEETVIQQSLLEAEERRRKDEVEQHLSDLIEAQEAKSRQESLEAENTAKQMAEKKRLKKVWLDRLDGERREQAKRAKSRKDTARAISNVIRQWTNDGVIGERTAAKDVDSQQISTSIASPDVEADGSRATPSIESQFAGRASEENKNNVGVVSTLAVSVDAPKMATRSRSVISTSGRPGLTAANLLQLQQMEPQRTDAIEAESNDEPNISGLATKSIRSEATVGAAIRPRNAAEKPEVKIEALYERKRHVPMAEEVLVADRATEMPESWRELHRKNVSEPLTAALRSRSNRKDRPVSVSGSARSTTMNSVSRRHSAPSIQLREFSESTQRTEHSKESHGQPNVMTETHDHPERRRSPQSDYRTASPSSPARITSFVEDMSEALQPIQHGEPNKSGPQRNLHQMENVPGESHPVSETTTPTQSFFEKPRLSLTSSEDARPISSSTEETHPRCTITGAPGADDTEADAATLVWQPSQAVTPSIAFPVVRRDTLESNSSERIVPGGWHHDFDEPEPVRKLRRSRSIEQQRHGGLQISQTEDTNYRRVSSVGLPRASMPETPTSPIRNWSHQE
jgi:tetratricopeptide (TPR) repeat protein